MPHSKRLKPDAYPSVGNWLQIVRAEYLEIPGLQLTRPQFQRLWGLDNELCAAVLSALTTAQFLHLKADGHYIRADVHGLSAPARVRGARFQHV